NGPTKAAQRIPVLAVLFFRTDGPEPLIFYVRGTTRYIAFAVVFLLAPVATLVSVSGAGPSPLCRKLSSPFHSAFPICGRPESAGKSIRSANLRPDPVMFEAQHLLHLV